MSTVEWVVVRRPAERGYAGIEFFYDGLLLPRMEELCISMDLATEKIFELVSSMAIRFADASLHGGITAVDCMESLRIEPSSEDGEVLFLTVQYCRKNRRFYVYEMS